MQSDNQAMEEEKDRIIDAEKMNSIVWSLYFSHLLKFVGLWVADEFSYSHEVAAIILYLIENPRKEGSSFNQHQFLKHNDGSKST